ncbi:hypothetical protein AAVH_35408 [Aphelenchoides avenae]|nr:hypothetical protein AAVH_35408 [Aphelenchus avenae]
MSLATICLRKSTVDSRGRQWRPVAKNVGIHFSFIGSISPVGFLCCEIHSSEQYLEWVLEAWYEGVTKDNLTHCLKEGNGIPNGLYELTKAREAAKAQELAEILAGFEIEAPNEDDTGHIRKSGIRSGILPIREFRIGRRKRRVV